MLIMMLTVYGMFIYKQKFIKNVHTSKRAKAGNIIV